VLLSIFPVKDVVMLFRVLLVLMSLSLAIAVVGCEGDAGPAGPAGPAGSDGTIASGQIDGRGTPNVDSSSPSNVVVTITDQGAGQWLVTLDGTFPSLQGGIVATVVDPNLPVALEAFISGWTTTQIVFDVHAWDTNSNLDQDAVFAYIVLKP